MMLVYTSITRNYLPKARVLAKSVKQFHPGWIFVLLYADDPKDDFNLDLEAFDEVLTIPQLGIPYWKSWAFGHSLVELCTAIKGPAAEVFALRSGIDKIMYLDPDIKVYNSLHFLEELLDDREILLTPHLLDVEETSEAISDNEISALKHGVFNLGFFAARTSGQGLDFIHWWADRLRKFCRDDIPGGLFTDQRWCDLAPAFFDKLGIVRDRGCNVATWNIGHRSISKDSLGQYYAGAVPLRFYHFTSYDNGNGFKMLGKYALESVAAHELWNEYRKELAIEGQGEVCDHGWFYGRYENGENIPLEARRLYRDSEIAKEVFPDPYSINEPCFQSWYKARSISFIKSTMKRIFSPNMWSQSIKSVLRILRHEGISGLILRVQKRRII